MSSRTDSAQPQSEEELVGLLIRQLTRTFGRGAPPSREVRTHGRARADLCLLRGGELISIEAKLLDAHRAIGQALLNTCFADRSYIAVWHQSVTPHLISAAMRWEVGVLAVGRGVVTIAVPAPRTQPNRALRDRVVRAVAPVA